ncbi:SGNH/GDSL hydrolase family protein [Phenylobacterium sp. LjRoot225]|uniref:SGNH/GDSL hydrolase family protein n=1 Tax=Phenylobacterium sp. LjRoot225 TaxID=3342285 RepID=UPI003ECE0D28
MTFARSLRFGPSIPVLLGLAALAHAGGPARADPLPRSAKYVAMGSSYAAGPGVTSSADAPANRCQRSADNYAHQLARRRGLALTDVSCSGATTANLLGPWGDLPSQLDAVDGDTRLVTVTIGGNDLGYIGGLMAASCRSLAVGAAVKCPTVPAPTEQAFTDVEANMGRIAAEVRRRAPDAQLVFVEYLTVLPPDGTCKATPLTEAQADAARQVARRLSQITARAAKAGGAERIAAATLSKGHDACAKDAWTNGYPRPGAPVKGMFYHPNLEGMTAIADALDRRLR